jgi:hypothetical protein
MLCFLYRTADFPNVTTFYCTESYFNLIFDLVFQLLSNPSIYRTSLFV